MRSVSESSTINRFAQTTLARLARNVTNAARSAGPPKRRDDIGRVKHNGDRRDMRLVVFEIPAKPLVSWGREGYMFEVE